MKKSYNDWSGTELVNYLFEFEDSLGEQIAYELRFVRTVIGNSGGAKKFYLKS